MTRRDLSARVYVGFGAAMIALAACAIPAEAERLPIKNYTSADGLGSNFVSYVMRDSRGFLWFCTRDGLSRFDGSRFVTYQVGGKSAPPGIEQIIETRKGVYWIATTGGLYRFDPNANLAVPPGSGRAVLSAEMVSSERGVLYEDRTGNLWIGGNGLFRLEDKDGRVVWQRVELNLPEHLTTGYVIASFCEGTDGSLWVVTNWGLLRRLPDGRETFYSIEPRGVGMLTSVLEDRGGRIWLTSRQGIYIIKPESMAEIAQSGALTIRKLDNLAQVKTRSMKEMSWPEKSGEICKYVGIEGLDDNGPRYLYETADAHIWIAGGIGPVEFDGRSFRTYTAAQGLTSGLGQLMEDSSGNLWLGGPKGLARLNRKGLTTYDEADGLRDSPIDLISEGRDGKLYTASEGFFISQFDGRAFHTIRPRLPANATSAWSSNYAFLDSKNEWWFLTTEGLHRFAAPSNFNALAQAAPLATYTSRDGLTSNMLFHIFEDSKNDLWISTSGNSDQQYGLSRWNRATEKLHTFSGADEFPARITPSSFAEDRGGNLWFGFRGGLMRYRDGRFTEFTSKDGLPEGLITALHLDQSGRIWVASALGGLGRSDDPTAAHASFVTCTIDNGLASNNVRCLTEDLYGNIYAGTARGVDRLSADGLHIRHYSVNDGLAGDFVYAAFRDRGGVLWFGTSGGLSRLAPQQDNQTSAPSVWLAGLRIAGESRALPELGGAQISDLELGPTQNNLQIDFFGIDFNPGEALRYQFMLEGADRDWSALTEQHTVNYAKLAPGSYRYLVRAVNTDGVASPRPASVTFRVLSPIWWRWWFMLGTMVLIAVPIVVVLRYRYQRMKAVLDGQETLRRSREERLIELERVRSRIATDLHDDIGSSLTQIAILSEVTRQHVNSGDNNKGSEPLARIISVANELVDTMSDIVWAINPKKDHLSDLLQRMRRFASDIFTARNIAFRFRASECDLDLELGANVRREVFLIFKESVNNIVKHSACTLADIEFRIEAEWLTLRVADNGSGFDSTLAPVSSWERGGNGLMSMRRRAEEMGGEFEIASRAGEGTTVTLRVLAGSARA